MAVSAIKCVAALWISRKRLKRNYMRRCKIADMNIIAHAGSIFGGVIGAEYTDACAFAQSRFHRDFQQMGGANGRLARPAMRVGASNVEIAQGTIIEIMRCGDIAQHHFRHQFGRSVGVNGHSWHVFTHWA